MAKKAKEKEGTEAIYVLQTREGFNREITLSEAQDLREQGGDGQFYIDQIFDVENRSPGQKIANIRSIRSRMSEKHKNAVEEVI